MRKLMISVALLAMALAALAPPPWHRLIRTRVKNRKQARSGKPSTSRETPARKPHRS